MEILAGLIFGFLGSFHCVAMCGPIAVALNNHSSSFVMTRLFYNAGRILTYSILGLMFGLIGNRIELFGLQQILSISIGSALVLYVLMPKKYQQLFLNKSGIFLLLNKLKSFLSYFFNNHSYFSNFFTGILNGLLPCGFVYVSITGALALGDPLKSSLFMAMFGVGTFPAMAGISLLGKSVKLFVKLRHFRLAPALTILLAAVFILRGLNLGIPLLSPKIITHPPQSTQTLICH